MKLGKLTVMCGPMFAGKTTELIKRMNHGISIDGKNALAVKTIFDDRYSEAEIMSHDGKSFSAKSISSADAILSDADNYDLMAFDEVQFFQEPYFSGNFISLVDELLMKGIDVLAAGLDMNTNGEPFHVTSLLLGMADEVIKMTARCEKCGFSASRTIKKREGGSIIELGGSDVYSPRCRSHWKS